MNSHIDTPRSVTWQPGDLAFLQLKVRDGLAGAAQDRLLAGDQAHVALHVCDLVLVRLGVDTRSSG